MTNEEARILLEITKPKDNSAMSIMLREALDMAIKDMKQEPCKDAISRQAVLDLCDSKDPEYKAEHLKEDVECLPPVNPQEPKTGQWVKIKPYPLQMHDYECSECGHETDDNTEDYCSDCGAKMR